MILVLKSEHLDYQGSNLSSAFFKIDKKTVFNRIHQTFRPGSSTIAHMLEFLESLKSDKDTAGKL